MWLKQVKLFSTWVRICVSTAPVRVSLASACNLNVLSQFGRARIGGLASNSTRAPNAYTLGFKIIPMPSIISYKWFSMNTTLIHKYKYYCVKCQNLSSEDHIAILIDIDPSR